jgi:hypothetical protein
LPASSVPNDATDCGLLVIWRMAVAVRLVWVMPQMRLEV